MRTATEIMRTAKGYKLRVFLHCDEDCKNCWYADACSIIQILLLGIKQEDSIRIIASSQDADKAIKDIHQSVKRQGKETIKVANNRCRITGKFPKKAGRRLLRPNKKTAFSSAPGETRSTMPEHNISEIKDWEAIKKGNMKI